MAEIFFEGDGYKTKIEDAGSLDKVLLVLQSFLLDVIDGISIGYRKNYLELRSKIQDFGLLKSCFWKNEKLRDFVDGFEPTIALSEKFIHILYVRGFKGNDFRFVKEKFGELGAAAAPSSSSSSSSAAAAGSVAPPPPPLRRHSLPLPDNLDWAARLCRGVNWAAMRFSPDGVPYYVAPAPAMPGLPPYGNGPLPSLASPDYDAPSAKRGRFDTHAEDAKHPQRCGSWAAGLGGSSSSSSSSSRKMG